MVSVDVGVVEEVDLTDEVSSPSGKKSSWKMTAMVERPQS